MSVLAPRRPRQSSPTKVLLVGDSGAGKTWFGLTAKRCLVANVEDRVDKYEGRFDYDVLDSYTPAAVKAALDGLRGGRLKMADGGAVGTFFIDSHTKLVNLLRGTRTFDDPKVADAILREEIDLFTAYTPLPCNLIVSTWAKNEWGMRARANGRESLAVVGAREDADRRFKYLFDIGLLVERERDEDPVPVFTVIHKSVFPGLPVGSRWKGLTFDSMHEQGGRHQAATERGAEVTNQMLVAAFEAARLAGTFGEWLATNGYPRLPSQLDQPTRQRILRLLRNSTAA